MTKHPLVSVIVSSCQRYAHLQRCLLSLAQQNKRQNYTFEVIIADDGSTDGTSAMVQQLSRQLPFKLRFVTQKNTGFRKARIVNKAIQLVESDYVLLTDGDCIFPPDHLQKHLNVREAETVWAGDCIRLSKETSNRITCTSIESGNWQQLVPPRLPRPMTIRYMKDRLYQTIGHRSKPKLVGNNVGLWLSQLYEINGFDEGFEGWGCEDDDLGMRLRMSGNKIRTSLNRTFGYHLWHSPDKTTPASWKDGNNTAYFKRPLVLAKCLNGIQKFGFNDLNIRVSSTSQHKKVALLTERHFSKTSFVDIDIEIRLGNSETFFNDDAKRRVQVFFPEDDMSDSSWRADLTLYAPDLVQLRNAQQRRYLQPPQPDHHDTINPHPQSDWLIATLQNELGIPESAGSHLTQRIAA